MAKKLALMFGIIFVLVGLLGFVGNPLVGPGALFETNRMHDLVHLIFGLILLGVAFMAPQQSSLWLKVLGVAYLLVAVMGFTMASPLLGLIEVNGADNWLHVLLGIVLLMAGFSAKQGTPAMGMPSSNMPMGGDSGPRPAM